MVAAALVPGLRHGPDAGLEVHLRAHGAARLGVAHARQQEQAQCVAEVVAHRRAGEGADENELWELAEALEIPSATLSFHLKELRNAGIVTCERAGRSKIYAPDFEAMRELIDFLTEDCCQGQCAPARRRRRR